MSKYTHVLRRPCWNVYNFNNLSYMQALLNLKPGRPLQTISYRSLPVNPNNLGKWDASAKQKGKEELGSKDWHHSHYRIWRRGTSPSEITNGMVQVVTHPHLHLFIKSNEYMINGPGAPPQPPPTNTFTTWKWTKRLLTCSSKLGTSEFLIRYRK